MSIEQGRSKGMSEIEREAFEKAYIQKMEGDGVKPATLERMKEMRDGEDYGDRAYLNGCYDGWKMARARSEGGEAEAVGFIPYSGLTNLAAGHPAKIYPVSATPSPFESHKLIYTHSPAANQGVPDWAQVIEDQCWDLRCTDEPTGGDDYEVLWHIVEHHMAEPKERWVASGWTPAEAVERALNPPQQQEGAVDV